MAEEPVLLGHLGNAGLWRLQPSVVNLSAPADLAARLHGGDPARAGGGVLSGYPAAELLGARCAPADTNAELTVRAVICGSSRAFRPP